MQAIKAIKTLVLVLGLLILVVLGLLGYTLYSRSTQILAEDTAPGAAELPERAPAQRASAVSSRVFGEVELPVPAGGRLAEMTLAGELVVLRVETPDGERVVVVDPRTGTVNGLFRLP
ncbi:hypothetical protein [Telmatospirillum sp. J64-1]|uniref:hypothetical protein n=1 Tax=Telmatospirillum sp. J64-1 TaxID=2502183 RepID=UPI00115D6D5A|nr:hypothetical protein [Telmatospirillum sp. J64-1]